MHYEPEQMLLNLILDEHSSHFWPDVKRLPVCIELNAAPDASIAKCLEQAIPILILKVDDPDNDNSLDHINHLNEGCILVVYRSDHISEKARRKLERRLTGVQVFWF